jgi:heptosyltransferase III
VTQATGKILVIRGGAIGDFILTIPVLQALKKHFPETHLEVLGYPKVANLAVEAGWAQSTKSIEAPGLARFFAPRGPVPPEWLQYFAQFDIIITYLFDPDALFQNNVSSSGKHHYIKGPHRPNEKLNLHAVDVFLKPLEKLAIYETGLLPDLSRLGSIQTKNQKETIQIAIHPGSGSPKKNWPLNKWKDLLQQLLVAPEVKILVVAGEAEREIAEEFVQCFPSARTHLMMNKPLDDVSRALSQSEAFIGHDSGISHMAAALELPSVILWGPTNMNIWRPVGKRVTIIESDTGIQGITSRQVIREVNRLLEIGKSFQ